MNPDIQTIWDIFGSISDIMLILGGIAGAAWVLYKFVRFRELKRALSMKIKPIVHHHDNDVVVEVTIEFTNTGTQEILVSKKRIEECVLDFIELPAADKEFDHQFDLSAVSPKDPSTSIKYFRQYQTGSKTPIILEPGVPTEVHGYGIYITKYHGLLLLRVRFTCEGMKNNPWIEATIIDTSSSYPAK